MTTAPTIASAVPGPADRASDRITVVDARSGGIVPSLMEALRARELLMLLVQRDVAVRYRQTALGIAWAIIVPTLMMCVYWVFFGILGRMGPPGVPYPVFFFSAMLFWRYFNSSVGRSATSLLSNRALVEKTYVPRFLLPAAACLSPVVDLLFGALVLIVTMILFKVQPSWNALWLPAFALMALAAAGAFGVWFAGLNAYYRDVQQFLPVLFQMWFFSTPIIYPVSNVPSQWWTLYAINPMVTVCTATRWALLSGHKPDTPAPTMGMFIVSLSVIAIVFVGGLFVFNRLQRRLVDVL